MTALFNAIMVCNSTYKHTYTDKDLQHVHCCDLEDQALLEAAEKIGFELKNRTPGLVEIHTPCLKPKAISR
jgi:hypothetical protein